MAVRESRELISPEQAQKYLDTLPIGLEYGIAPRLEKVAHTAAIARDLANGEFEDTGETIKFHDGGFLADGQHRLRAVVLSGVTREWAVIRGLSTAAVKVLDSGVRRSARDVFTMAGTPSAHRVVATLRKMYYLAAGSFSVQLSHKEYEHLLENNIGVIDSVRLAARIPSFVGPITNFAAIHYIGANFQGMQTLADEYIQMMAKGSLEDGSKPYPFDAATAIRERCLRDRSKSSKWTQVYWIKLAAYGWLQYSTQTELKNVKVPEEVRIKGWTVEACLGPKVTVTRKNTNKKK